MISKRQSLAAFLFLIAGATAVFSVPHIAVLDTLLAPGIDPSVIVPVTDKISEELLNSGNFTVIDRANVEQVLREKEFQLSSGVVRNEEVRQAGEYLGADFVVVANASRVGSTYVISAKMIDVISGEIAAQASSEKQGKIDVLLEIARVVGKQISGREIVVVEVEAGKKIEEIQVEVVQPVEGGNQMAVAQLQQLIRTRTHMKQGGDMRMKPLAAQLSEQEKMMLYTSNRKDNATTGLLLNLLLTSLGSWVQGDVSGALIEISMALSGGLALWSGSYYDYWGDLYLTGLGWVGVAVLVGNVVYMCVRPFQFVRQWNQSLANVLQVPYIGLLDPRENTFTIVPTAAGVDWRFGLNLISIEY